MARKLSKTPVEDIVESAVRHHKAGRLTRAEQLYRAAKEKWPENVPLLTSLGHVLVERGEFNEGVENLSRALILKPDYAPAREQLAEALRQLGHKQLDADDLAEAEKTLEQALGIEPGNTRTLVGLGRAKHGLGDAAAAEQLFRGVIGAAPDHGHAHWNLSQILLQQERYDEGWREYRWRWSTSGTTAPEYQSPGPVWTGEPLDGRTLLVWSEQGVGDELMFATCLGDVMARAGGGTVVLACDGRLAPLFERTFPGLKTLPVAKAGQETFSLDAPAFDVQISAGDLPAIVRATPDAFPQAPRPFVPDPKKATAWRARLDALGPGAKVGVAWRGGIKGGMQFRKSTDIGWWTDVLSVPGVAFVNLQYGDSAEERAQAEAQTGTAIHHFDDLDAVADPEDQMALIAGLDLVIQTTNASAHMAGMLGVPLWVLLPHVPDWRWPTTRATSPWYPNARLYRQPVAGDWTSALAAVAKDLRAFAEGGRDG